ncbi:MAG: Hint domain-containing protein [Paracoccus sp. (in: a-proteobacteria)]|uniref:Hint domain-containing protein n=1 Tax=Paracoccus sp. TaxID=267 RepID=UPI0039E2BAA0
MAYSDTGPLLFFGNNLATATGYTQTGNPGDANFSMTMNNLQAVGTAEDIYRVVWYQNVNNPDTTSAFQNGQMWRVDVYDASADDDDDPTTGDAGWAQVYTGQVPKDDIAAGLGSGGTYVVFESGGSYLVLDVAADFTSGTASTVYDASDGSGTLAFDTVQDAYEAEIARRENAICFARGTLIKTPQGVSAIEGLRPGDLVLTRDNGAQVIRWIGAVQVGAATLAASPRLRPIRIRAGALGEGIPSADLVTSPQHRVLVRSRIARRMFGATEVLVAAKNLLALDGIEVAEDLTEIEYFHMLFDRHELVISNGAETESLFTGPEALKSVGLAARQEILALFPELAELEDLPVAARILPPGRRARRMAERHQSNRMPLQA